MGKNHARNGVHFFAVAALLCGICSAMYAEPSKFKEPIHFYGAQVVGFEKLAGGLESFSYRFELALTKTSETEYDTKYALETISGNGVELSRKKGATLLWAKGSNQPKPNYIYVSLLLELESQFGYQQGMFGELILVDENDHQYSYQGFPRTKSDQGEGWLFFDYGNTPGQTLMVLSSDEYPKTIGILFEVPIESHTITLHFKDQEKILFTSVE